MTDQTNQPAWNTGSSIYRIDFEPRPVMQDISIVIPTLGRPILEQSLFWIAVGSAWPGCLIVVEQGANPDVAGWLCRMQEVGIPVNHIRSDQRGRSAGVNRGLEQVRTTFACVTDDDCFVEPDWLEHMLRQLRANPHDVVTGRIEAAGEDVLFVVTSTEPAVYHRPRLKFDSMSGGNMGTSRDVIARVGLFDEDACLRTAEDAEWGYRVLRSGVTIRYAPDVCLRHFGWRDPARRLEMYRGYALSHGGFYGKYLRRGDLFILARAGVHMLRALRNWVRGKRSGNAGLALLGQAYFRYLPVGMAAGLRSKSRAGQLQ